MSKKDKQNKIGRNSICFCGSGKKYKRCHGNSSQRKFLLDREIINKKLEERYILEVQRKAQQGLGKPIIATDLRETRAVLVGNKIYQGEMANIS